MRENNTQKLLSVEKVELLKSVEKNDKQKSFHSQSVGKTEISTTKETYGFHTKKFSKQACLGVFINSEKRESQTISS